MRVLGIESSCDETGIALYEMGRGIVSDHVYSQADFFAAYGGVVPELASRDHIRRVLPLLNRVLHEAQIKLSDCDAIAYTQGPGLAGALLVGASIAVSLSMACDKPLIPIHHLEGHLLSPLLPPLLPMLSNSVSESTPLRDFAFPYLALMVSGGHSQLVVVHELGQYEIIGDTIDDAAGEAFDKSAQLLGIPYPGGAELSRVAQSGVSGRFNLPRPLFHSDNLDFSFSGLKTAVLNLVNKQSPLSEQDKADIAHAFVESIVSVLVHKTVRAIERTGLQRCAVVGGVSANTQLRKSLSKNLPKVNCIYPDLRYCSDNGAMIALAGALRAKAGLIPKGGDYAIKIKPRWAIDAL